MPRASRLTLEMKSRFVEEANKFRSCTGKAGNAWLINLMEWANKYGWRLSTPDSTYGTYIRYKAELKKATHRYVKSAKEESLEKQVALLQESLKKATEKEEVMNRNLGMFFDGLNLLWYPITSRMNSLVSAINGLTAAWTSK